MHDENSTKDDTCMSLHGKMRWVETCKDTQNKKSCDEEWNERQACSTVTGGIMMPTVEHDVVAAVFQQDYLVNGTDYKISVVKLEALCSLPSLSSELVSRKGMSDWQ